MAFREVRTVASSNIGSFRADVGVSYSGIKYVPELGDPVRHEWRADDIRGKESVPHTLAMSMHICHESSRIL